MEWKEVRLGDVCNIITGFPFPGKKYSKEGIRVVRGDNVTIGNLRWDTEKDKRWNEPFDKTEYYSLQANDIVIGMDGSRVGKIKQESKRKIYHYYLRNELHVLDITNLQNRIICIITFLVKNLLIMLILYIQVLRFLISHKNKLRIIRFSYRILKHSAALLPSFLLSTGR